LVAQSKNMTIEFQSFFPENAKELNTFLIEVRENYSPPFSDEKQETEIEDLLNRKERAVLVIENKKIIGFVAWKKDDENSDTGVITNEAVQKQQRNRGIGTKLFRIALQKLRSEGYKKVNYVCEDANEIVKHLSKKFDTRIKTEFLDDVRNGKGHKTLVFEKEL